MPLSNERPLHSPIPLSVPPETYIKDGSVASLSSNPTTPTSLVASHDGGSGEEEIKGEGDGLHTVSPEKYGVLYEDVVYGRRYGSVRLSDDEAWIPQMLEGLMDIIYKDKCK